MGDDWKSEAANIKATQDQSFLHRAVEGVTVATPLDRAEAAIMEVATQHPEVGQSNTGVEQGANEVWFKTYGDRSILHHHSAGSYLLYGLINQAYWKHGGAKVGRGAALGPMLAEEAWGPPAPVNQADGSVDQVPTREVRFTEGTIRWVKGAPEAEIHLAPNSTCRLQWDFHVVQQRSGNEWHDNDWLSMLWFINEGLVASKTVPLTHEISGDTAVHGRPENPGGRTPIRPVGDYVICNRHDLVSVVYWVENLSGMDPNHQVEKATQLAQQVADWVAPKWMDLAINLLPVVPGGGAVAAGAGSVLNTVKEDIIKTANDAWTSVIAPGIEQLVNETRVALGGHADCDGPILNDAVIFDPLVDVEQELHKTYTQPRVRHCQTPETTVTLTMQRTTKTEPIKVSHRPSPK